jgi:glyoxylase-like metal-dependent hydrolase (beta-lactamase superfamily II)
VIRVQIHQIGGLGFDSNIYLIIDEVIALIDAGTGMNFETVTRNMGKFGLKPSDIKLLINTHCHFDHIGGDRDFIKAAGCEVAIHELEADLLRKGDQIITLAGGLFGRRRLEPTEVVRELHEGDWIDLGEFRLQVLHTPGHTSGSISLFEPKQRLLFAGDTIFSDGIGRVDLPTGDAEALHTSITRLTELKARKMYPGHGPTVEKNAHECIMKMVKVAFSNDLW